MKICENCGNVINKPFCIGCLEREIEFWLSKERPEVISEIRRLLISMVDFNRKGSKCIVCNKRINVCNNCYLEKIYEILKEKDVDLADEFKFLFLDLESKDVIQKI